MLPHLPQGPREDRKECADLLGYVEPGSTPLLDRLADRAQSLGTGLRASGVLQQGGGPMPRLYTLLCRCRRATRKSRGSRSRCVPAQVVSQNPSERGSFNLSVASSSQSYFVLLPIASHLATLLRRWIICIVLPSFALASIVLPGHLDSH